MLRRDAQGALRQEASSGRSPEPDWGADNPLAAELELALAAGVPAGPIVMSGYSPVP
jgi:hypothetical protein